MVNAIEFEIGRQIESLSNGIIVENETRSFDPALKMTLPMRDKEAKQDYRFDLSYLFLFDGFMSSYWISYNLLKADVVYFYQ